jgi:hypothetical protein
MNGPELQPGRLTFNAKRLDIADMEVQLHRFLPEFHRLCGLMHHDAGAPFWAEQFDYPVSWQPQDVEAKMPCLKRHRILDIAHIKHDPA